jgi:hypothetical protein
VSTFTLSLHGAVKWRVLGEIIAHPEEMRVGFSALGCKIASFRQKYSPEGGKEGEIKRVGL